MAAGLILLALLGGASLPGVDARPEHRLTCNLVAGGQSDPRWVADRDKFGVAFPASSRGDLVLDPAGPSLLIFETGNRATRLVARRNGPVYVARKLTDREVPGGYAVSVVREFAPATGTLRVWLEARAGEDRWGVSTYRCAPVVDPDTDEGEEPPAEPEDGPAERR